MSTIINATTTNGVVIQPDNSGSLVLQTNSGTTAVTVDTSQNTTFAGKVTSAGALTLASNGTTTALTIDTSQNVGIGTTSPSIGIGFNTLKVKGVGAGGVGTAITESTDGASWLQLYSGASTSDDPTFIYPTGKVLRFGTGTQNTSSYTERMRIDSSGNVLVGKTSSGVPNAGAELLSVGVARFTVSNGTPVELNRLGNDGDLIDFYQATVKEGSISVSGTTVSYNGGHLSRWSQWQNETGKPNIYRGTVLDSVDAMCEWEKDGEPLPNEQATKTIVSTTTSSKAVAGVFDRYDEDDENNPYDFYVAQSGDFVIRIAQGVTVQNGDLLESAGDGTAKPQADDICRSSTIAKVTSNYVSATYEDGSYCVPCILMIG
jgi:hypothetical protein